jgi:hypothetical protein
MHSNIKEALAADFIRPSTSPGFFGKKMGEEGWGITSLYLLPGFK